MFDVVFDKTDVLKYMRALYRLQNGVHKTITEDMQHDCATDLAQRISHNILTQKFANSYPWYSEFYAKWKKEQVTDFPAFWKLTGALLRSVTAFRAGGDWAAGVLPGSTNSEGESIEEYGMKNEFGGGKVPSRPLFEPTMDEYESDRGSGWERRAKLALQKIEAMWR